MNDNYKQKTFGKIQDAPAGGYRPDFALYHSNVKGTGCALKMNLHPAHDDHDGSIMMTLANQKTIGSRTGANPVFPTFDWDNRMTVKLDFTDLAKMLQVFRGEKESLEDGRGLYHIASGHSTKIVLRHLVEPFQGYSIELYRTMSGQSESDAHTHIILSDWEALGLSLAIENSFGFICFGIPRVIRRAAEEAEGQAKAKTSDAA